MSSKKYSPYTINEVEAEEGHIGIFVINQAPINPTSRRRNQVVVSIPRENGQSQALDVAPHEYPVNLTERMPRANLLRSTEFRTAIFAGLLQLVKPSEAMEVLSTPEAQRSIRYYKEQQGTQEEHTIGATGRELDAPVEPPVAEVIKAVMRSAVDDGEESTIEQIKAIKDKTREEYEYVLEKAKELSFNRLVKMIEKRIASMDEV